MPSHCYCCKYEGCILTECLKVCGGNFINRCRYAKHGKCPITHSNYCNLEQCKYIKAHGQLPIPTNRGIYQCNP